MFRINKNCLFLKKTIISSIIVDKLEEYTSVLLDFMGFHPSLVNVELVIVFLSIFESNLAKHNNEKFKNEIKSLLKENIFNYIGSLQFN
jgi:hypothetical protein